MRVQSHNNRAQNTNDFAIYDFRLRFMAKTMSGRIIILMIMIVSCRGRPTALHVILRYNYCCTERFVTIYSFSSMRFYRYINNEINITWLHAYVTIAVKNERKNYPLANKSRVRPTRGAFHEDRGY